MQTTHTLTWMQDCRRDPATVRVRCTRCGESVELPMAAAVTSGGIVWRIELEFDRRSNTRHPAQRRILHRFDGFHP